LMCTRVKYGDVPPVRDVHVLQACQTVVALDATASSCCGSIDAFTAHRIDRWRA